MCSPKKPYNPVLGEFYRCQWKLDCGARAFFLSEQVSHHPPASAYFYSIPRYNISIEGVVGPKSKFLGNSATSIMNGFSRVTLGRRGETYLASLPNYYVRGLLIGQLSMELCDDAYVICPETRLATEVRFRAKPLFGGTPGRIDGTIGRIVHYQPPEALTDISFVLNKEARIVSTEARIGGRWDRAFSVTFKNPSCGVPIRFDSAIEPLARKAVPAPAEQHPYESQRIWQHLTRALQEGDFTAAEEAKALVENHQRDLRVARTAQASEIRRTEQQAQSDPQVNGNPPVASSGDMSAPVARTRTEVGRPPTPEDDAQRTNGDAEPGAAADLRPLLEARELWLPRFFEGSLAEGYRLRESLRREYDAAAGLEDDQLTDSPSRQELHWARSLEAAVSGDLIPDTHTAEGYDPKLLQALDRMRDERLMLPVDREEMARR
ncbi:hypothetical protein H696_02440 [Fonticula alba]|uniref:Oxysterol-binding protein n=1 Tax=Fonticula alba TaxID=691883 RepID=A0A058ZC30_FONAL|nr:hypothetical protein H696_02440 [Fonticula alba]KCV71496.1 hypothetical protein H696_02440 [Fonticula alba]|eukprot:XP_009494619.1 hypothetical protein H696_02440 [Fonticula alba]